MSIFYGSDVRKGDDDVHIHRSTSKYSIRWSGLRLNSYLKPSFFGFPYSFMDEPWGLDSRINVRSIATTRDRNVYTGVLIDVGIEICSQKSGTRTVHKIDTINLDDLTYTNLGEEVHQHRVSRVYKLSEVITGFDPDDVAHMIFTLRQTSGRTLTDSVLVTLLVDNPMW